MATENKKLLNLAKGKKNNSENTKIVKEKDKVVEIKLTPEQERDIKAKETVKNLLDSVDLEIANKKEDLFEIESVETEESKSNNIWLQEQIELLTSENQLLKTDLNVARGDFQKLLNEVQHLKNNPAVNNDNNIKNGVLSLFHEIQSNYIKMGFDPVTHNPNLIIPPAAFMNRMILFFPFLQNEKRF